MTLIHKGNGPERRSDADVGLIREALRAAEPNILRMALYQITRDPDLRAMQVEKRAVKRGAFHEDALAEQHHETVRQKGLSLLLDHERNSWRLDRPSDSELVEMMEMMTGQQLLPNEIPFALEELALDEHPREVTWRNRPPQAMLDAFHVLVIGSGISGLAAGVQLKRLGIPFTIVERQPRIGGTWAINTYPDARVDTTSFLYQFRFEKNYPWTEYFARQPETLRYLEHIVSKYDLLRHVKFNTEVQAARWDEQRRLWSIDVEGTAPSRVEQLEANVILSASGLFNKPKRVDIPGAESFRGSMFHTTEWDHSVDWEGRRVALIGTGSTGTQLMPRVADTAGKVLVLQRTPNWIIDAHGYREPVSPEVRWLFDNVPFYWNWYCYESFVSASRKQYGQSYDEVWRSGGGAVSAMNDNLRAALTDYIHEKLADRPDLLEKCVPTYAPLARRLIVDNGWYDALRRDNVELITDPITRITPNGLETGDGRHHQVDIIVVASGFQVSEYFWPTSYEGRDGASLEQLWKRDGARAHLGMVFPGFPNFFAFYGPNGQPRAGGFYSWAEIWARYALRAVTALIEGGHRSIECRQDVFDDYNARLDAEMKTMIWEQEGRGAYNVNEHGRPGVNMPWATHDFHAWLREPDLSEYHLR